MSCTLRDYGYVCSRDVIMPVDMIDELLKWRNQYFGDDAYAHIFSREEEEQAVLFAYDHGSLALKASILEQIAAGETDILRAMM